MVTRRLVLGVAKPNVTHIRNCWAFQPNLADVADSEIIQAIPNFIGSP
jgi:hypothetical protein